MLCASLAGTAAACTKPRHQQAPERRLHVLARSNDAWEAMRSLNTEARRSFERMLRKLLTFPNKPAVLLLNAFAYRVAQAK